MTKKEFIRLMTEHGDALVYYTNTKNKIKYFMGTLDFSTPYIQKKTRPEIKNDSVVQVFCWDTDKFKQVNPETVQQIVPLSLALNNEDNDTL